MDKLVKVVGVIIGAYLVIIFLRWVFSVSTGVLKYSHWGFTTFGFNIIEAVVIAISVFVIFGLLIKKN